MVLVIRQAVHRSPMSVSDWGKRFIRRASLERYAGLSKTKVTINQLLEMGRRVTPSVLLQNAKFVHKELPIRLAHSILEIEKLPYFAFDGALKHVYDPYVASFKELTSFPPIKTQEDNERFTKLLTRLVADNVDLVDVLAVGLQEVKRRAHAINTEINIDFFIGKLMRSRIGRRVLAEQHIQLHQKQSGSIIGVIDTNFSPLSCLKSSVELASQVCKDRYGLSPDVVVHGSDPRIPYIPNHLQYVMFEILKNAQRATIENHNLSEENSLPQIHALVAEGEKQVTVRITDRGGGVANEIKDFIFKYGFSTSTNSSLLQAQGSMKNTMAGLGFGLPLSRLYAQYFGGGLQLVSMDGYGSDVYIRLDRTGDILENVEI